MSYVPTFSLFAALQWHQHGTYSFTNLTSTYHMSFCIRLNFSIVHLTLLCNEIGTMMGGRSQVGAHQVGVLTGGRNHQVGLVVARQKKNGMMMDGTNLMTSGKVVVRGGTSQKRPSGVRMWFLASLARLRAVV